MIKRIVSLALVVLLGFGIVVAVTTVTNNKTKRISPLAFSVGGINETTGQFEDNDEAICTKELIECQGLTITPSFNSKSEYQIYWYNTDEVFLNKTEKFGVQSKFDIDKATGIPDNVRYCRIVIYPDLSDVESGEIIIFPDLIEIESSKIRFYEPVKYSLKFVIKVNKVQKFSAESTVD